MVTDQSGSRVIGWRLTGAFEERGIQHRTFSVSGSPSGDGRVTGARTAESREPPTLDHLIQAFHPVGYELLAVPSNHPLALALALALRIDEEPVPGRVGARA